jgi:hypothetical protein
MTNKLLHAPTQHLREATSSPDGPDAVQAVTRLFDLPEDPAPPAAGEEPQPSQGEEGLPH